jgi:beta-lactamase regulating signal transducer with metallopeptidase domain
MSTHTGIDESGELHSGGLRLPARLEESAPADVGSSLPDWGSVLVLLFIGLAAVLGCRLALGLWAVHTCRRRCWPLADPDLGDLVDELRQALGVRRPVAVAELAGLSTPATVGWRRPLLLLPEQWRGWTADELRSVLAHELAHIRRRDYAGWLLARLAATLHGYHPLVLWLTRRLRDQHELAADALAAPLAGGPTAYARALCRLALHRDDRSIPGPARAFLPTRVSLTRRIEMVLSRNQKSERSALRGRRLLGGLVLLLACLALAGVRRPAAAETSDDVPPPAAVDEFSEIAVEIRILALRSSMAAQLGRDFAIGCLAEPAAPGQPLPPPTQLSDVQLFLLMEACQADDFSNVVQAPKLTLFTGQTANLQIQDFQQFDTDEQYVEQNGQIVYVPKKKSVPLGIDLRVQPVMAGDFATIDVNLRGKLTSLDSTDVPWIPVTKMVTPVFKGGAQGQPIPFTQFVQRPSITTLPVNRSLHLTPGQTAAFGIGKRIRETEPKVPPALEKIPYVKRLWRQGSRRSEIEHLVMLVSARPLPAEDEPAATSTPAAGAVPTAAAVQAPAPPPSASPADKQVFNWWLGFFN